MTDPGVFMEGLGPLDPRRVGVYDIVGKLGEGGMGHVYKGRSPGGRSVAVKLARPELASDPGFRQRFRAEVAAARRVGGFHTAQVVDADPEATQPWMVTAFIAGRSLDRVLLEDGPFDEPALRSFGAALAEALQAIHACGLVHRDLKPANILMSDDGPRVVDFGIARALQNTRLTDTGTVVGTPGFLAPEQITGGDVGPATDVFALGAVLAHAAGALPFGQAEPMALMYRAVHSEPDLAAVPAELRPLVASCMAKRARYRPSPTQLLAFFAGPQPAAAAPEDVWSSKGAGSRTPTEPDRPQPDTEESASASSSSPQQAYTTTDAVVLETSMRAEWLPFLGYALAAATQGICIPVLAERKYPPEDIVLWAMGILCSISFVMAVRRIGSKKLQLDATELTVVLVSGYGASIPWLEIVSIAPHEQETLGRQDLLVTVRRSVAIPVNRKGIKVKSPTEFILPLPSGAPISHADRRQELAAVVARFAPHVDTESM